MTEQRKLRVFLCHASQDKPVVRDLYQRLLAENWIEPWLDEEKLLPGQDWDFEIEKAVEASDAVIVCVSSRSVTKEGYVQKELRKVLEYALEKPEETIFIIPLRLDDCEIPRRLRSLHYVDYFPADRQERAHQRLLQSLSIRFSQLQLAPNGQGGRPIIVVDTDKNGPAKIQEDKVIVQPIQNTSSAKSGDGVGMGPAILLTIYFVIAALESFSSSSDTLESLLAFSSTGAAIALLRQRQIPTGGIFKFALITYLLIYGFGYRITNDIPAAVYVAGAAAALAAIMLVRSARLPGKRLTYSTLAWASFLFLVAVYEITTNFEYSSFTTVLDTLILMMSIVSSALLWGDF